MAPLKKYLIYTLTILFFLPTLRVFYLASKDFWNLSSFKKKTAWVKCFQYSNKLSRKLSLHLGTEQEALQMKNHFSCTTPPDVEMGADYLSLHTLPEVKFREKVSYYKLPNGKVVGLESEKKPRTDLQLFLDLLDANSFSLYPVFFILNALLFIYYEQIFKTKRGSGGLGLTFLFYVIIIFFI